MKHYIIYVPGIGDTKTGLQEFAVKTWRLYGVRSETVAMRWAKGRDFDKKLEKLLNRIDELTTEGYEVSLVGASAGGSVVMNAFAARPNLHAVVGICVVMNTNMTIGQRYYKKNPAFKGSMEMLPKSLEKLSPEERHRIMSVRAAFDPIVQRRSTAVRGALHRKVWSVGHAFTIAFMITFGARIIVRFAKKKAKQYGQPVKV